MTLEEMKNLPPDKQKELFHRIDSARQEGKVTNYSSQYGIGAAKLAKDLKISHKKAKLLLTAYWKRNKAILDAVESFEVKIINGDTWVKNPVSNFWYSLRNSKDRWSTVNQGTATYCFDRLLWLLTKNGVQLVGNFHDEWINLVDEDKTEEMTQLANSCIKKLNQQLKLNVPLSISVKYGRDYSQVH